MNDIMAGTIKVTPDFKFVVRAAAGNVGGYYHAWAIIATLVANKIAFARLFFPVQISVDKNVLQVVWTSECYHWLVFLK